jgi:phage gpG-like protein
VTRFGQFRGQLYDLSSAQTRHDLYNLAGRDVAALVQKGFATEHDPYGVPWRPSAAAKREGRKTLRKTGALQDGIRWMADSRKMVIKTTGKANKYAAFHQFGTVKLPQRQFLPTTHLPPAYERQIHLSFQKYLFSKYGY